MSVQIWCNTAGATWNAWPTPQDGSPTQGPPHKPPGRRAARQAHHDKAKGTTRNHIRSLENAISNMEGKRLRQHRHDIEWHRKYILALGCMVLFLVGSSLGALVGRGGLGVPTLLALCLFLLYYSLSMLGEQLVKVGSLSPWSGMWLSTMTLLPLAVFLMWSTTKERRWIPRWGSS